MTLPQLQESEDEKKDGAEKKDDSIVYADLDKSAMSEGENHNVILDFKRWYLLWGWTWQFATNQANNQLGIQTEYSEF